MTRDEIMALTPEQLRVEIAKAKGWTYKQESPDIENYFCRLVGNKSGWWNKSGQDEWICAYCHEPFPDWPTDISAAWELVEEVQKDDSCWLVITTNGNEKFACSIHETTSEDGTTECYANESTAPLAICRAWLLWKQEGEK
jgi:hypothetical protein